MGESLAIVESVYSMEIQEGLLLESERVIVAQVTEHEVASIAVGEPGPPGPGLVEFTQSFSSALQWTVNHNLGKEPLASVKTVGGIEILPDILHMSVNQFVVTFAEPTAGRVRCF